MSTQSFMTLYKLDNTGGIREWNVYVEDCGGYSEITVAHGVKDGAIQEKVTEIDCGKSIGRANETTHYTQALLEAESKWKKQCDKGYGTDPKPQKVFLPMLAQRYDKHPNKLKFPCYIQSKMDGCRSTLSLENGKPVFRSRMGKKFKVLQHLEKTILPYLTFNPNIILDGELFSEKLTFQEITSAIKRDYPNSLTKNIEFWYYDCYLTNKVNSTFKDRWNTLQTLDVLGFVKVETYEITKKSEIASHHSQFLTDGYEGSILRNANGIYKVNGRSYDLLKVKDFMDEEFEIVGAKKDKNGEVVFTCVTLDETPFDCKPDGCHEDRVKMWIDRAKHIGQDLTVRFFEWTTSDKPVPRFPVGTGIRLKGKDKL